MANRLPCWKSGPVSTEMQPRLSILVSAPYRSDAAALQRVLGDQHQVRVFETLASLSEHIDNDAGAILVTEEALLDGVAAFDQALKLQSTWSDIPIVLLASSRNRADRRSDVARLRLPDSASNVVVIERPLSSGSLISAVASALRSRHRQFEMRDRLAELADQRSKLQALLENVPVGICFVDLQGRTVVSNALYDEYVPGGLMPSQNSSITPNWVAIDENGALLDRTRFPGARALAGESVKGIDFCHRTDDGTEHWRRVSASPLRDAHGRIIGAASSILDIDEEKQAELLLRRFNENLEVQVDIRTRALNRALKELEKESIEREQAQDQLRHSLKMDAVGQLTGGIAHDFNNMLTGILGALDLMQRRMGRGQVSDLPRYMDAARSSALRAAALTERLLAFSRRQSLDSKPMAPNELIVELRELLNTTVTEQIEVKLDLSPDLPWAHADSNQLENALLNLVINARDAMPNGGVITVSTDVSRVEDAPGSLEALPPGDYVRMQVRDTGVGIPAKIIDKVFEPFFTTKPLGEGTGLGLSMVYGFARQSHGRLSIASKVGEGTVVSLLLPAVASAPSDAKEPSPLAVSGGGQLILLVEDDESVRMLNHEVLMDLGYQVYAAEDGQRALEILDSLPHLDLLLTDVGLPGMNGRQLAERVQSLRPNVPVLFLTGYAAGATSRESFLGANMQLLTKPFTLADLATKIDALLANRLDSPK